LNLRAPLIDFQAALRLRHNVQFHERLEKYLRAFISFKFYLKIKLKIEQNQGILLVRMSLALTCKEKQGKEN